MIQCQNCGQVNAQASNFCRFCGTKFLFNQISNNTDFEQAPRRPYSWSTDEFQVADAPKQKPRQINQVQPLGNQISFVPPRPQPLVYQKPQPQNLAYNLYCPRCASQVIRYERKISTAGWIVFAALLITFFPLFWIGLLIKENVRVCQVCNYKIG
jgi:hypothetical protein